ncbi:MAG: hypothetical protein Q9160_001438 [Pyrenula sp. 1 TL-2023]
MKNNGNTIVNRKYNPRNVKPNLPLDVEEVDTAVERFIRQKYAERSLGDGRPKPPPKDDDDAFRSSSDSPPRITAKKGRLFGFGLRATSSAYPASKHDKKNIPVEPTLENAFHIPPTPPPPNKQSQVFGATIGATDSEFEAKLMSLKEMGFPDNTRNAKVLRGLNGNLERTIESLCRLGEGSNPNSKNPTPVGSARNTPQTATFPDSVKSPTLKPPARSTNPFDNLDPPAAFGLSFAQPQQQNSNSLPVSPTHSTNPFGLPPDPQNSTQGLEQSFQGLQVSRHLFPHSTGGYPSQPPHPPQIPYTQSMTPPIMSNNYNPFFQQTQAPPTSNPAPQHTPYMNNGQQTQMATNTTNPFISQNSIFGQPVQSPQAFDSPQQGQQSFPNSFPIQPYQQSPLVQQNTNPFGMPPTSEAQPSVFPQAQQQAPTQQPTSQPQQYPQQALFNVQSQQQPPPQSSNQNPFPFQNKTQSQPQPLFQPHSQSYQPSPQPLLPQPTGRFDKSSILALYNYPQLAPQKLPTIHDVPTTPNEQSQPSQPQPDTNSAPNVPVGNNPLAGKRSVTMPASAMSRNPFLSAQSQGQGGSSPSIGSAPLNGNGSGNVGANASASAARIGMPPRHSSRESADVSSLGLQSGRHSPDAFASLSARFA